MNRSISIELQRKTEEALRNRRRLADYYRKRAALNAMTGKSTRIQYKHRALIGAGGAA